VPTGKAPPEPRKLGNFDVLEEIGQGGMGVVYLARQQALDRTVVIKKMRRDLTVDPSAVERFQREARAAAAVHHQNVVAVYDCFSTRGDYYIAGEHVDGPDLRSVLDNLGTIEPRVAALIALQGIRGLEEIHARGIIHRDLKPGNILIGRGGETKIADFGIALDGKSLGLTRPGMLMGSIPYLSPEQMLGERVDYRSDLFGFGILLYEMIAGAPPFEESDEDSQDTLLERMQSGRYTPPRSAGKKAPRYLRRLLRACLQAKLPKRVATATRARRQLERGLGRISPADCRMQIADWMRAQGVIQPEPNRTELHSAATPAERPWLHQFLPLRRWLVPAGVAFALIGSVVIGSAFGLFGTDRSPVTPVERASPATKLSVRATPPLVVETVGDEIAPLRSSVPVVPPPVAELRVVAWPWAEVRIEGQEDFFTPRAGAVSLPPGNHVVVFEHPTYGQAEYSVELAANEQRVLRHIFEEAPQP
jgi:serine/threonine-protein kinase